MKAKRTKGLIRAKSINEMPARAQVRIDALLEQGKRKEAQRIIDAWHYRKHGKLPPLRTWSRVPGDRAYCGPAGPPAFLRVNPEGPGRQYIAPACLVEGDIRAKGWFAMVVPSSGAPSRYVRYDGWHRLSRMREGGREPGLRFKTPHAAKRALERYFENPNHLAGAKKR